LSSMLAAALDSVGAAGGGGGQAAYLGQVIRGGGLKVSDVVVSMGGWEGGSGWEGECGWEGGSGWEGGRGWVGGSGWEGGSGWVEGWERSGVESIVDVQGHEPRCFAFGPCWHQA
jgi:hypothetical protein